MAPIRLLFRLGAHIYLVLFPRLAFATPQNVTVDDAVLTGPIVPQYLPSATSWNQGNNCSICLAKPDPSQAYNSTWHDATFAPNSGISQAIQFAFEGSALYIFFILANTIPRAETLTDVVFYLDEIAVGTFVHVPSTTTDYQYNVPVYVNESLSSGKHEIIVQPVNSGNAVLMLFDYLVYTTDMDNQTTPDTRGTTPGQNTAAIIGGTVGGLSALVLAMVSLLCYRRYKKRRSLRQLLPLKKGAVLGSLDTVAPSPIPFAPGTSSSPHWMESRAPQERMRERASNRSPVTLCPPSPAISVDPPSTASLFGDNAALLEQVELLREEVSRLHHLRRHYQNGIVGVKGVP